MAERPDGDATSGIDSLSDPRALRGREDVPVEEVTRVLDPDQFEGVRRHYEGIDGMVQVGITTPERGVLLQGTVGSGEWAPPGGPVDPDEDWVDDAVLVEKLVFRSDGDPDATFTSYGVSFGASLADDDAAFAEDPTIVDHPLLPEDHDRTFDWFETVPGDANENHVGHVERFLEWAEDRSG